MTVAEALSMVMDLPSGDLQTTIEIRGEYLILDPHSPVSRIIVNPEATGTIGPRGEGPTSPLCHVEQMQQRLLGVARLNGEDL